MSAVGEHKGFWEFCPQCSHKKMEGKAGVVREAWWWAEVRHSV